MFRYNKPLLLLLCGLSATCTFQGQEESPAFQSPYHSWTTYLGDQGRTRYSALQQIDTTNITRLQPAWEYHTGDSREGNLSTIECNPIIVGDVMYVTSPRLKVIALQAATGQELWTFDPFYGKDPYGENKKFYQSVNRGVTYWEQGADRRIFFTAMDKLYALDAASGEPVQDFGSAGSISLKDGLDLDSLQDQEVWATTPATAFQHLIITGSSLHEGPGRTVPGHVRAYDALTGEIAWTFHTIPQEGEAGTETWEEASWKSGSGANAWAGMSLDEEKGKLFLATGSPSFDFYGGKRIGDNLYGNSVVALDAATGALLWSYQIVHHDLWDYDLPCPPVLVRLQQQGQWKEAVAQATKHGFVFVLDRETGKPLFPVEERHVPPSAVPGEKASATQPFPLMPPPFVRQHFADSLVSNLSDSTRAYVKEKIRGKHYGSLFTPPSLEGTVVFPGLLGGANWSGAAYDPTSGWLYVNANEVPNLVTLTPQDTASPHAYQHLGYIQLLDQEGYPAVKPPWGTLTAIDLQKGSLAWQVRLGAFEELNNRGIPPTGTPNMGGCIVSAGGLLWIAATKDEKFRAFHKRTGELLWETKLPYGGYATPSTYAVDGRQYVVVAAGGGGKMKTASGDVYMVFALPEEGL